MTDPFHLPEGRLIEALAQEARGPRRNGLYAVWLFTRAAAGLLPPDCLEPAAHGRRLALLERRLSSLSLPAPLRRGLAGGLQELAAGTSRSAASALRLIAAPVRETLGGAAGEAIAQAAREARDAADALPDR